jgi:phage terminase large subunit-like protein
VTVLQVPAPDPKPWPTLGPQVWDWMLDNLVYGPGDLRGVPLAEHPPDDEFKALLFRMYEVHPYDSERAGRRRFRRCALSLRKGTAKTERAAWIAAAELSPGAPVRADGFRRVGKRYEPVGVGVRDPYIPMVAYTEEQTEDLAFAALYTIISEGPLADEFDVGLERIVRAGGDGRAVPLAAAPDARDGARTTFQHFDEGHRLTTPRLVEAHGTMQANLAKRRLADPWSLETTTAHAPGEGSVAEHTWDYAQEVRKGTHPDPSLFFFHRGAGNGHDLTDEAGVRAAVIEASGPAAAWSDIDGIVGLWRDPTTDPGYFERVWLNRPVQQASQAFDAEAFAALAQPDTVIAADRQVTLGFDGSRFNDHTGLVATDIASGHQIVLGHWRPEGGEVPVDEVEEAIDAAFHTWQVQRFYADPAHWESQVSEWAGTYGKRVVEPWWTHRQRQVAAAVAAYAGAIRAGELSHDGNPELTVHVGNARRRELPPTADGERPFMIRKERPDSPHKIDLAMAAILSWEARRDALTAPMPEYRRATFDSKGRPTSGQAARVEKVECRGCGKLIHPEAGDGSGRCLKCTRAGALA